MLLFLTGPVSAQDEDVTPGVLAEPPAFFEINPEEQQTPQPREEERAQKPEKNLFDIPDQKATGSHENRQESATLQQEQTERPALFGGIPFDQIPEEYLEEMDKAYEECSSSNFHNKFLDCECWAMRFLEKRIEMGPEAHYLKVKLAIENTCPNPAGIAGYTFNQCAEWRRRRDHLDYEDYCKCVANTVALNFAETPRLSSVALIELRKDAFLSCGYSDIERENQVEAERMLERRRRLRRSGGE